VLPAPPAAARRPLGESLRLRQVQAALAFTLLGFTAIFSVAAYLGPIATRTTGLAGAAIGGFQAAVGLGAILGVILGGRIADRSPTSRAPAAIFLAMLLSLLAYTPLLVLGPQLPVPAAATSLALLALLGAGALFTLIPLVQLRLASAAPQAGPVLFGLNGAMVFAGQGAGALLGGVVADTLGYAAIGPAGAAVAALALLVVAATATPRAGSSATSRSRQ
jgi:predicted MFS family arabinose efflux permease